MASFGNNIADFNKEIFSFGTVIFARVKEPGNLLLEIFGTYSNCIWDNGSFTCYIEILESQYNDGTLSLESKYFMDK